MPKACLEAVEIDGGNTWHKFRHITVPMMTPIIFFNFLMSLITNLQVFVPAYALTRGGPGDSTLFMVYLIFREGFMRNSMGYASALSLIFFVFIALLTVLIFRTSNARAPGRIRVTRPDKGGLRFRALRSIMKAHQSRRMAHQLNDPLGVSL